LIKKITANESPYPAFFAYVDNDDYKRVQSLERFADGTFRQDIISNDLGPWIINGEQFSKDRNHVRS
jgi:hypothetical protein